MKKITILFILICSIASAKYPIYAPYDGFVRIGNARNWSGDRDLIPEDADETYCEGVVKFCGTNNFVAIQLDDEYVRMDGKCTIVVYDDLVGGKEFDDFIDKYFYTQVKAGTLVGYSKTAEGIVPKFYYTQCNIKKKEEKM